MLQAAEDVLGGIARRPLRSAPASASIAAS
jgi:hypothetical protein